MAMSTYAELCTAVASWLHRTDLTAQVPDFVMLAESEINADAHTRLMESDETVTITSGAYTIALPDGYIEPIQLEIVISGQANITLLYQPPHRLLMNVQAGASCRPYFWTVNGGNIEFPNLSDANYTMTFRMVKGFDLASTLTNTLIDTYPGIYLFGTLLQAAPYLKDVNMISVWQSRYDRLVAKMKRKEGRDRALTSLITDHPSAGNPWRPNIITG